MTGTAGDRIAACLARGMAAGATASQIADAVGSTCRGIEAALAPIVGRRGVAALFDRCLRLTARAHPWLLTPNEGMAFAIDGATLRPLLAQRADADAGAAGLLFLTTFDALLNSLIGATLTERLLDPVWADLASGLPVQDLPT